MTRGSRDDRKGLAAVWLASLLLWLPLAGVADGGDELFPRPPAIREAVAFWTRIYTEVDTGGGLLHDDRHLGIVYETIRFTGEQSRRSRERQVKARKRHYRAILRRLAQGRYQFLTAEEKRVLALWPKGTGRKEFLAAARRLRFQLGQADKFRAGLERAGQWESHIRRALREEGVPDELAALPHVESSYNPRAWSRVGAAGLWQFTRSTGRRYLRIDHVVDERMDPWRATHAAARLLRHNYDLTGSWPLAITAYNHGVSGMRRAAEKLGTRDIGVIVEKYRGRTFGFASRNFYAAFLAALDVSRDAERWFGPVRGHEAEPVEELEVPGFVEMDALIAALGLDRDTLRRLNPALREPVWNGTKYVPRGYRLRVPAEEGEVSRATLATLGPQLLHARQIPDRFYTVRRGDTLSGIAARYDVRPNTLAELNGLRSRHFIRVGQVLRLPFSESGSPTHPPGAGTTVERPADGIYRVRRGDTLSRIARRFDTTEKALMALNGLRDRNRIYAGQRLRLPVSTGSGTILSAGSAAPPAPAPQEAIQVASIASPALSLEGPAAAAETAPAAPAEEAGNGEEPVEGGDSPLGATAIAEAAPQPELAADPSNYQVAGDGTIEIQPLETLGHYAEWLGIRASRLRHLNGMRFGEAVVVGRRLKLDFHRVTPAEFEKQRVAFHRQIQEAFFRRYRITGTHHHTVRRGEAVWLLASRRYRVPFWLLRQYNPDVDLANLRPGTRLAVPLLEDLAASEAQGETRT